MSEIVPGGQGSERRAIEFIIPIRALLLVVAVILGVWALFSIADALLLVFTGVFLAFVFEYPLRALMRRTRLGRGLAATILVLGSVLVVTALALLLTASLLSSVRDLINDSPDLVADLREKVGALGDTQAAEEVAGRCLRSRRDLARRSCRAGRRRRQRLQLRPRDLHARLRRAVRAHRHAEDQGGGREHPGAAPAGGHARRLGANHDDHLALGDRGGGDRRHRRHGAGHDRLAPRLELRAGPRRDRRASSTSSRTSAPRSRASSSCRSSTPRRG